MMKLTTIYYLIFIFLFVLFSTNIFAATDSTFIKADRLKDKGDFYHASLEYERIVFSSSNNSIRIEAAYKKAQVLKLMNEFDKAQKTLEQSDLFDIQDDSIHFLIRQEIILCAYLASNFEEAESYALQIAYFFHDSVYIYAIMPLQVLVLNELNRWRDANLLLNKYISSLPISSSIKDSLHKVINEVYNKKNIPKLISIKSVQTMSSILPGLGQIYSGYIGEGIISFTFNVSSLLLAGISFWNAYYLTGYFAGLALFQKFYFGGLNRLTYLTKKRNYIEARKFNDFAKTEVLKLVKLNQ